MSINKIDGPSTKSLIDKLGMKPDDAALLKALMDGKKNSEKVADDMGLLKGYYNMPPRVDRIMLIANKLLDGSGVEYIPDREDSYTEAYGLNYINSGDTYDTTLFLDLTKGKFFISSVGYELEKHSRRFGDADR